MYKTVYFYIVCISNFFFCRHIDNLFPRFIRVPGSGRPDAILPLLTSKKPKDILLYMCVCVCVYRI